MLVASCYETALIPDIAIDEDDITDITATTDDALSAYSYWASNKFARAFRADEWVPTAQEELEPRLTGLGLLLEYLGGDEGLGLLFCPSFSGRYEGGTSAQRTAAEDSYPSINIAEGRLAYDSGNTGWGSYLYRGYDEVYQQVSATVWEPRPQKAIDFDQTNSLSSGGTPFDRATSTRMVAMDYGHRHVLATGVVVLLSNHDNDYVNILYGDGRVQGVRNEKRVAATTTNIGQIEWQYTICTVTENPAPPVGYTATTPTMYDGELNYVIQRADMASD